MRSAAEIFFKVRKTGDLPVGVNVWNIIKEVNEICVGTLFRRCLICRN